MEGPLALKGNIHMSMFDIHAACENEDDIEGEELEHLRLDTVLDSCAGIFKQSVGTRNRVPGRNGDTAFPARQATYASGIDSRPP